MRRHGLFKLQRQKGPDLLAQSPMIAGGTIRHQIQRFRACAGPAAITSHALVRRCIG